MNMNRVVFIIGGYLASGKSTFARRLSSELKVPYLVKDTFKMALCNSISITRWEESSVYSTVTFDAMMYVTERLMEAGVPVILEGNFVPAGIKKVDEAGSIRALIEKYEYRPLTYKFTGDTRILHKRYIERDKLPERGQVNAMLGDISYNDFDKLYHNLDYFFVGGEVIEVDTTDFSIVDFDAHIEAARLFRRYD